ncbi:hypothetical protein LTR86_009632 [Recurvomyces mirabilis]|nr:hypothetical protein LTR86_009632 [Recurvomyces mirabilis]
MRSTRHSLPAAGSALAPSSSPAPVVGAEMSAKQKREMKRLNIDAKAGIVGDMKEVKKSAGGSEEKRKGEVYRYRGAVYQVKGDEPEEWLQQEPERFKCKKRKADEVDGEGEEGVGHVSERKKRRVGDVMRATGGEDSTRAITTTSSTSSKKRERSTSDNSKMDATTSTPTKRKRSSDTTDEVTDPRPRKQGRTTITTTTATSAPAPPSSAHNPTLTKKNRRPQPTAQEQRRTAHAERMRLDFTINGGHDSISTSQARREAIAMGYQVLPFPQSALDEGRTYRRESAGDALEGFLRKLVGLNGEIKRIEERRRELEGSRAEREKGEDGDADGKVRRTGVNVVELPAFAARKAAFLARRDSGVGSSPPPPAEAEESGKAAGRETFSEDRAEEVLRQGRMMGESFQERDARFERERGVLDALFAGGKVIGREG